MILDKTTTLFSLDGERMIVLHDGPYPACYTRREFEFDGTCHRARALWATPGNAQGVGEALQFLAGDEIELLT